jgi:NitT/TauT family transport system substrate-binding protein
MDVMRTTLILMMLLLLGCDSPREPLRIASLVWPGYETLYLARSLNYFDAEQVRLIELISAHEVSNAIRAGKVDAAMITLDEALVLMQDGVDLRVVLVMDASFGADMLMVRPEIKRLSQLKGKRIGLENAGNGALVLDAVLTKAMLKPLDVKQVHMVMSEQVDSYRKHLVDAVISYEPASTQLRAAGAVQLFDSREIPGRILDVLVVRADALQRHEDELKKAIYGHFSALKYIKAAPLDAAAKMAPRLAVGPESVLHQFDGIKLPSVDENRQYLEGDSASLRGSAQSLVQLMRRQGLLRVDLDVSHLADASYLPESKQ